MLPKVGLWEEDWTIGTNRQLLRGRVGSGEEGH